MYFVGNIIDLSVLDVTQPSHHHQYIDHLLWLHDRPWKWRERYNKKRGIKINVGTKLKYKKDCCPMKPFLCGRTYQDHCTRDSNMSLISDQNVKNFVWKYQNSHILPKTMPRTCLLYNYRNVYLRKYCSGWFYDTMGILYHPINYILLYYNFLLFHIKMANWYNINII